MVRSQVLVVVAALVACFLSGCSTCPEVREIDASTAPPALVQVLFSVQCDGEPVTEISRDDLTLTEGGTAVEGSEAEWIVQPHSAALETYTLLLIDVSASILEAGTLETAQEVATEFVSNLIDSNQHVAVGIFDGSSDLRTVVGFTQDLIGLTDGIAGIGPEDQLDGSTNLNGAVLEGLQMLDDQVAPDVDGQLMSVGNLVLFTDGVDRANRESDNAARSGVSSSDHQVFVVGLVGDEAVEDLEALGRDGFFQAEQGGDLLGAFESLTTSLLNEVNKYYRLSYCSPLRKPKTTLKVEVLYLEKRDSIRYSYKTEDFEANCILPSN